MSEKWLGPEELVALLDMPVEELQWYQEHFAEQLRVLSRRGEDGRLLFAPDAVLLLRGLSGMRAQGATPEQIKGWFGLAASEFQ